MWLTSRQRLIVYIFTAFCIDYLPIISLPFLWSETFFHEISHGIAALLTGGDVHGITLRFDGSGICVTSGGIRFFVVFSGYAGSALWGVLIYKVVDELPHTQVKFVVSSLLVILTLALILWARDISTVIILLILLTMFILPLYKSLWKTAKVLIQLTGVFVVLDAIRRPLHLLDGKDLGDGASLEELTWLPEFFWVVIWVAFSLASLYMLWRCSDLCKKSSETV